MDPPTDVEPGALVRRHRLSTRIWHWINALAVIVLLMSGLMILNAHPRLYWGEYGANFDRAWLELPRFPGWLTIPSTYDLAGARRWHLAFAWLFSNTVYALHYAHLAYSNEAKCMGLSFPDTAEPLYWDFVYFAFTIGMTFQTSDVTISDQSIRRIVAMHGLAAFAFNIGVLAFTINVLGGG